MLRITRLSSGQVAVLMALAMPVLLGALGLGADLSIHYYTWEQLQAAADAAALAGAGSLPNDPAGALSTANQYAIDNGVQQAEITSTTVAGDDLSITVSLKRVAPYYFAQVLGLTNVNLEVSSTAGVQRNPASATGLIPIGLSCDGGIGQGDCAYQPEWLQLKSNQVGPGNWAPLELGGTPGANEYRTYLEQGYNGTITPTVPTEPGNVVGPTGQAINDRLTKAQMVDPAGTNTSAPSYDPRLVVVPLIAFNGANGKKPVTVVGYAQMWIDSLSNNNNTINAYFLGFLNQPIASSASTTFGLNTPILWR